MDNRKRSEPSQEGLNLLAQVLIPINQAKLEALERRSPLRSFSGLLSSQVFFSLAVQ